jgi:type IV secretory pathway TraG/TraD family ATPase VirD4
MHTDTRTKTDTDHDAATAVGGDLELPAATGWPVWRQRAVDAGRYVGAATVATVGVDQLLDPMPTGAAVGGAAATVAVGRAHRRWLTRTGRIPAHADPLGYVRDQAAAAGSGAFIGIDASDDRAGVVHAPAETAVLVLGPPRRGKSSGVIIPSVLTAPGAVISTSTKPDVLSATATSRSRFGDIWLFDPTGETPLSEVPDGVRRLRWSPLDSAREWGAARRLAQAMVGASPAAKGTRHEGHWTSRAAALLAPMLYAASGADLEIRDVVAWVLAGKTDLPTVVLQALAKHGDPDADIALQVLQGVEQAADQERQSIWSTTADVIDVYTTHEALAAASQSNWQPGLFVDTADTIYIAASAEHQRAVAPLVVALLEAVRNAQYARHRSNALNKTAQGAPVTFALDEVANVAPIESLPAIVSEAGGQGLHVIAAVQDLSQVRGRWGADVADGFLSLFQHVLVLGGVRDTRTLEAVSTICGDYDRPQTSASRTRSRATFKPWQLGSTSVAHTASTHRQRRLDAGEIYALADGTALHLHGSGWRTVDLAAHYAHPRWTRVLAAAPDHLHTHGGSSDGQVDADGDGHLEHQLPDHLDGAEGERTVGPTRVPAGLTEHPVHRDHQATRPTKTRQRSAGREGRL